MIPKPGGLKPRPINAGIGGTWDELGPHTGGPEPF